MFWVMGTKYLDLTDSESFQAPTSELVSVENATDICAAQDPRCRVPSPSVKSSQTA